MKFSTRIEEALRDESLGLADCPEGFIDAALDALLEEDSRRGWVPHEYERGIRAVVIAAAKKAKGE